MIILLSGTDSYRISQKLNKYKEKFLRDIDSTGINIETLEGGTSPGASAKGGNEVTVESFRKAVLSGGLFVKKRLVIIRNLFSQVKDKIVLDEIEVYVKKSQDNKDTILIFIQTESHKSQASKLFKTLVKQKFSESLEALEGVKLNNWIKKYTESCGGKISPQAIQFLASNIGSDLWQMSNEIDKLVSYKNGNEITLEDVQQFIKTKLDENIFNLCDAFGRKDKALALKLISDQIGSGATWPYLLAMLARQIKIVLQIKTSLDSGTNQYNLAKDLGLHPFVVKKTIPQTRFFSLPELKKIYSRLLQIDLKLKTSGTNPEVLFDLLVVT